MEEPDRSVDFPTLGFLVADWIEAHCIIPDGFKLGQPFRLYNDQLFFLCNHYRVKTSAVWVPSDPVLAPAFFYRRSQLVRPQKWGKGPLTAAIIANEGAGPSTFAGWARGGETYDCRTYGCGCGFVFEYEPGDPMGIPYPTPLIQLTATSEEQTDNVYRPLQEMIRRGPLGELMRVGEEFIRLAGNGRIDVVTSSATSRLGNPITFALQDETGIWLKSNHMQRVADTQRRGLAGMGGRSIETTNPWDPSENSVAQTTYESRAEDIFKDFPQAPASLSYGDKRERRRIHRFAYGDSLRERGGHIDLDSIEAEAMELLPRDPSQAERFFGCRLVYGQGSWLPAGLWEGCFADALAT